MRAATLAPTNPQHLLHQGWALIATDQHERAVTVVQRAIALDPRASEPYWVLSGALYRLDRFPEATAAVERSFAITPPSDPSRLVYLCGLYRRARAFEPAYVCLEKVLRMDPKNQQALRWMRDAEQNVAARRRTR